MAKVEINKPIVDEIMAYMQDATAIVLLDYRGLTVEQDADLRKKMRASHFAYKVYKCTYLEFCFAGTVYEALTPHLLGPTAVAFSHGDSNELEDIICEFGKDTPLTVKGAVIEGVYYDEKQFYLKVKERQQEEYFNKHIHEMVIGGLRLPITRLEYVLKRVLKQKQKEEREREFDEWNSDYIRTHGEKAFEEMLSCLSWEEYCGEIVITGIKFPKEEIWIPAKINDKLVTWIRGESSLSRVKCDDVVKSIRIPGSVTRISKNAFWGQQELKIVKIPKSVKRIDERAFCPSSLKEIIVEEGNPTYTSRDSEGNECNAIIETTTKTLLLGSSATVIPDGIITIGKDSFFHNTGLRTVRIPKSVQLIADTTFHASGIIEQIIVDAENEKYTSRDAYGNECNAIIDIERKVLMLGCSKTVIPNGIVSIGEGAFLECAGLEKIVLPRGLKEIGWGAFNGCSDLKKIEFPDGLERIGQTAFSSCVNLEEISFPESLEEIGWLAFWECKSINKLTIPKKVNYISSDAFKYCTKLCEVTICSPYIRNVTGVFDEGVKIIYAAEEAMVSGEALADGIAAQEVSINGTEEKEDEEVLQTSTDFEQEKLCKEMESRITALEVENILRNECVANRENIYRKSGSSSKEPKKRVRWFPILTVLLVLGVLALLLLGAIYEIRTGF